MEKKIFRKSKLEEQGERGGSGQGLQSNACVRALPERSEGIRYVRRNGAHSVSDCVEKAWRQRSKDTDVRRYACPVCRGKENENSCMMSRRAEPERHNAACFYQFGNMADRKNV